MAKKECPSCAMQIDENETVCPVCGFEFPSPVKYRWFAIVMLILLILALLYRMI